MGREIRGRPPRSIYFAFCGCQIGFAYWLAKPMGMGPTGVFISVAATYSLAAVIAVVLFRRGRWKEVKV